MASEKKICLNCAYCDQEKLVCLRTYHPELKSSDPVTGEINPYQSCYIAVDSICKGKYSNFCEVSKFRNRMKQFFSITSWMENKNKVSKF